MEKFEIGKRYKSSNNTVFEVIKRTAKRVTFVTVYHSGNYNEHKGEEHYTKTIKNWAFGEIVFFDSGDAVEAVAI